MSNYYSQKSRAFEKAMTVLFWILFIGLVFYGLQKASERDAVVSSYWTERQDQCRSLGSTWDLNSKGECVQHDFN